MPVVKRFVNFKKKKKKPFCESTQTFVGRRFVIELYALGRKKHTGLWKYRCPDMAMAGSLAHKQEGQSLNYLVHMLQRLPTPGQVSAWPLFEYAQSITQFIRHVSWKPSVCPRLEVSFFPLDCSRPSPISLLLGLWSLSAWV